MIDLGDIVPLTVELRDTAGALANASAVVLTVGLPDGTSVTPSASNPSVGRYQYDFPTSQVGRHSVRWLATGTNAAAYTDQFDVRLADPAAIMSLTDAKRAVNFDLTDTSNDEELRGLIEAVTVAVENYRNEKIVRRTMVDHVSGRLAATRRRLTLAHSPVISVTSVFRPYDAFTWDPADVVLVDPEIGEIVTYGTSFYGDLVITYVVGYPVIPANYVEGAKHILKHLWEIQQTPGLGTSPFTGDISPAIAGMGYAIPNRAAQLLGGRGPQVGG